MPALKESKHVDLNRYVGSGKDRTWHQVAAFPSWFQRGCEKVSATYTKKEGFVEVRNKCTNKENESKEQLGKATTTDKENVLGVKFFPLQPKADYIIEFVDDNYNFAVVGSSKKNYLWILARDKVTPSIKKQLVAIAKKKGYNTSRLEYNDDPIEVK